jgi:tetratricopeptide (TPR) repeat protein
MGGILTLVCGVLVLVGVFTPWLKIPEEALILNGWQVANYEQATAPFIEPYLVLGGGIAMTVCVLLAFLLALGGDVSESISTILGILSKIAAVLVAIGATWFIVISITGKISDHIPYEQYSLGYGGYISIFAAVIGLIFGRMPSFALHGATISDTVVGTAGPSRTTTYSQRELLERQARGIADDVPGSSARAFEPRGGGSATGFAGVVKDHMSRASELEAIGEYEKAIGEYGRAIALDKAYAMAYFNRGALLIQQGRKADAIIDFEKVIEIGGNPELERMAQARIDTIKE